MTGDLVDRTKNMLDNDSYTSGSSDGMSGSWLKGAVLASLLSVAAYDGCETPTTAGTNDQQRLWQEQAREYRAERDSLCYKLAQEQAAEITVKGDSYTGGAYAEADLDQGNCEFDYKRLDDSSKGIGGAQR